MARTDRHGAAWLVGKQLLVGLEGALRDDLEHLAHDLSVSGQELIEGMLIEDEDLAIGLGTGSRGARRTGEQRHFAEELAIGEVGQNLLVAARVGGGQADSTAGHDEQCVARVTLATQDL